MAKKKAAKKSATKKKSARKSSGTKAVPVEAIKHASDTRKNIPTEELRDFVPAEPPGTMLYPREPSLDPQLVWKGKVQMIHIAPRYGIAFRRICLLRVIDRLLLSGVGRPVLF